MKNKFKILLFYAIGMACVFTLVWRASDIDQQNNNTLVSNYDVVNSSIN